MTMATESISNRLGGDAQRLNAITVIPRLDFPIEDGLDHGGGEEDQSRYAYGIGERDLLLGGHTFDAAPRLGGFTTNATR